jgi:5'-methylthioadenosine phosphorylase
MIGVIGGTGLGEALFGVSGGNVYNVPTPFGEPSGPIRIVEWHGVHVALLARHGEGHAIHPSQVPYRANIYALKAVGVTHVIASGAVGSLREELKPRELVIPDQVIDRTYRRIPTFFDEGLAVHVEFAEPFCEQLRQLLIATGKKSGTRVHPRATYVCMEGPAFSTVAESHMHRAWSGDLIGMTVMPEAKLAREAELSYAMVALVTDYDCWKPHEPGKDRKALLQEISGHLKEATSHAHELIRAAIEACAVEPLAKTWIHSALDLGVWTNPTQITPELTQRYGVLLQRFLDWR